ncbi:hypothetical protein [Mammaliicoccus sciuri]|uniref:hypothetical protein n=1 Tax=Mammaliicoccus sciuri TaxID=1296 RepID=UPI0028855DE0|nr:hypothetical protein [Mammaliicoccus sciuri]MDT0694767.1 hypothetical protein [Mammaliicoccus sciuri]
MAEINIRYLQDADGDRYFPMTHIESVIGLEEMSEGNETNISELNNKIEELTTNINTLNTELESVKEQIATQDNKIASQDELILELTNRIEQLENGGAVE